MFEDFLKRMTKGFGATMFLITLPVVMLVVGFRYVRFWQLCIALIMRLCGYRRGNFCL